MGNAPGYNVIVGTKGGRLDLLLNTVYYLNRPIENVPWDYYKEFLQADHRSDQAEGKFAQDVGMAIPVCWRWGRRERRISRYRHHAAIV